MDRQRLNDPAVTWLSASLLLTLETGMTTDLTWHHRFKVQVSAEELWTSEVHREQIRRRALKVLQEEL